MDIKDIISKMTLEEKAGLCSGSDFWHTKSVERLNIPQIMVSDGPHGLRKQRQDADHLGINDSIKAVCFPTACATAASFDREVTYKMGQAIGKECQAEDVAVVLGPAVNIKRSPLCGRNFEYFSEDPYVASEMAESQIKGVQSQGVGTSIKHFFANNQEHRRLTSSSDMDERTAREIYLAAFEGAVKKAKPATVMSSYNKINGTYVGESKKYLTDVLRTEWGFDGMVMSDWGAVSNRVAALEAGLDLEMPSSGGENDKEIIKAIKDGSLSEEVLDTAAERILKIVKHYMENQDEDTDFEKEKDHILAEELAAECMVLLKNDNILPLDKKEPAAFIGEFAKHPRYQGGGSSHINSFKVDDALTMAHDLPVSYAQGYEIAKDEVNEELIKEAVKLAKTVKTAVIFAGLPDNYESEGYDRQHMRMPECQNQLIAAVADANPNTVVVLFNGSPVEMPWISQVKGVIEAYLCGQGAGKAIADLLYGDKNPSGHLAETFPLKLSDNPSYLYYKGEGDHAEYREGVFVGYRYYDTKKMDVLFPFGHGLSYTSFTIDNIKTEKEKITDKDTLKVSVDVTNTGKRTGKEVVQLYVAAPLPEETKEFILRPVHELRGFEKVELEPGQKKTVLFTLDKRAFSYYDMDISDFRVPDGTYTIEIGDSSRNITATKKIQLTGTKKAYPPVTIDTTVGDLMENPYAMKIISPLLAQFSNPEEGESHGAINAEMMKAALYYSPIRNILSFSPGKVTRAQLDGLIAAINGAMMNQ